jgi:hypothetical protein
MKPYKVCEVWWKQLQNSTNYVTQTMYTSEVQISIYGIRPNKKEGNGRLL